LKRTIGNCCQDSASLLGSRQTVDEVARTGGGGGAVLLESARISTQITGFLWFPFSFFFQEICSDPQRCFSLVALEV
jgi:hypothetical protein